MYASHLQATMRLKNSSISNLSSGQNRIPDTKGFLL